MDPLLNTFCTDVSYENFKKIPKKLRYKLVKMARKQKVDKIEEYYLDHEVENNRKIIKRGCQLLMHQSMKTLSKVYTPSLICYINLDKTPSMTIQRRYNENEFVFDIHSDYLRSERIIADEDLSEFIDSTFTDYFRVRKIDIKLSKNDIQPFMDEDYGFIWNRRNEFKQNKKLFPKKPKINYISVEDAIRLHEEKLREDKEEKVIVPSITLIFKDAVLPSYSLSAFTKDDVDRYKVGSSNIGHIKNGLWKIFKEDKDKSFEEQTISKFYDEQFSLIDPKIYLQDNSLKWSLDEDGNEIGDVPLFEELKIGMRSLFKNVKIESNIDCYWHNSKEVIPIFKEIKHKNLIGVHVGYKIYVHFSASPNSGDTSDDEYTTIQLSFGDIFIIPNIEATKGTLYWAFGSFDRE